MARQKTVFEGLVTLNSTWWGRAVFTIVIFSGTLPFYQYLNRNLEPKYDLSIWLDHLIPYWPWTVSIYMSVYIMYLGAAALLSPLRYLRLLMAMLIVNFTSYIGFITLTSHYPRPSREAWMESAWSPVIDWMVAMDPPGNTFPSLHVSSAVLLGLALRQSPGGLLWTTWGGVIALSTLTIKQHFIWDVVGGTALAMGAYWWVSQRRPDRKVEHPKV